MTNNYYRSPKLFIVPLEKAYAENIQENIGINIDGEILNNIYADDALAIEEKEDRIEEMLNIINEECKQIGLKIHRGKTQYMSNCISDRNVKIDGEEIEKVQSYKYLGSQIEINGGSQKEIDTRIRTGWGLLKNTHIFLKIKDIPMKYKTEVYNKCILTAMTYGAETWTLTSELERRLRSTQRAMERSILNISLRERIRHTEIRKKTKVKDIIKLSYQKKWKWAGHLARREDNRWTKRVTEWIPRNGRRSRGRQKKRWYDDIEDQCGKTWMRRAKDRKWWRSHEEGYVLKGLQKPEV